MLYRPMLGSAMSGALGGIVASRNSGGTYFRQRATPVNPNSGFQQTVRNAFGQLTGRWRDTLTAAQRDEWEAYAEVSPLTNRIGDQILVSGLAMYIRGNTLRVQAGLAVQDDGPSQSGFPSFSELDFTVDAGAGEVNVDFDANDGWVDDDDTALLIYASRAQSPGVAFFDGPYRVAGAILGDATTPPTSPATLTLPFPVAAGQRVFFRARLVTDQARASDSFRGGVLVS